MKKMLTFIAVAVLATASIHAASVTWQATGLKDDKGVALNGAVAYLFNTADVSISDVKSALENKKFSSSMASKAIATKATNGTGAITLTKIGNYSNETVELFMIVFDKDAVSTSPNYMVSSTVSQTFTTTNKSYNFNTALSSSSWAKNAEYVPVPEPCTVALLALGLVAVGMKRKVA